MKAYRNEQIKRRVSYDRERVLIRFQVPREGEALLEQILTEEECRVLSGFTPDSFTFRELTEYLLEQHLAWDEAAAADWVKNAWKRGILRLMEDGSYRFGDFYGRLDIFAVEERKTYHALPEKTKQALDDWYFRAYVSGLKESMKCKNTDIPTEDRVLTLEEALAFVDEREDTPYLADCDCRVLKEGCEHPVRTCITYRTAENSFARKGLAVPITKEEARKVVLDADAAGLMHTANPGGLCNCCGDCCYLFRASGELGLWRSWPAGGKRIEADDSCIGCGKCVNRCHFGVLKLEEQAAFGGKKRIYVDKPELCVGCGICRQVCPVHALRLKEDR